MSAVSPRMDFPWRNRARQFFGAALHVFLPPVCVSCDRLGPLLCETCQSELNWLREPLCQLCGRQLAEQTAICDLCARKSSPLRQIRAAVVYDGPAARAIHRMKYEGLFAVSEPLAELMVMAWAAPPLPVDLAVPIPLHPEREQERGYNQAELLARHFCQQLGLTLAMDALWRARHTRPQVGLNAEERLRNVAGAFRANPALVTGKHIMLVDDVCTTGATLAAAAESLLENGAQTVVGYCVARAAPS